MDIDLDKVKSIKLNEVKEYLDKKFYREIEVTRNNEIIFITLCGDKEALQIINNNDLYLEPLSFDYYTTSSVADRYMFQEAINNIIKVLNKITQSK